MKMTMTFGSCNHTLQCGLRKAGLRQLGVAALLLVSLAPFLKAQPHFSWARHWCSQSGDHANTVAVDGRGNVVVAGYFSDTADMDPGPGSVIFATQGNTATDGYISKFNAWGILQWAIQIPGTAADFVHATVDTAGNVYATGSFFGTVDFDPGPGITNLTPAAYGDVFVSKYDSLGHLLWARAFGGNSADQGLDIQIDQSGNVYTAGAFDGTADLDPGPGVTSVTSLGLTDVFVSKLDPSGNFLWGGRFGGTGNEKFYDMDVDGLGNVSVTGYFLNTVDFDLGTGVTNLTSAGGRDAFIAKYAPNGTLLWAKSIGGTGADQGTSLASDPSGNLIAMGCFANTTDLDPGPGIANATAAGVSDTYMLKLDPSGNLVWHVTLGNGYAEFAWAVSTNSAGDITFLCDFAGTLDANPGTGTFNLNTLQYGLAIVALTAQGNFQWALHIEAAFSIMGHDLATNPAGNIYLCGQFGGNGDFNPNPMEVFNQTAIGGDDAFLVKLVPCTIGTSTSSVTACDTFFAPDGGAYTSDGQYRIVLPSESGCDSIANVTLTLQHSTYGSTTANGCDSVSVNGQVFTASGTYVQQLQNAVGCDSLVTVVVSIDTTPAPTISQGASTLTASPGGFQYQWLDCNAAMTPIPGATQQSYSPPTSGSYSVVIMNQACLDTSTCTQFLFVGTAPDTRTEALQVWPNPSDGQVMVMAQGVEGGEWELMDALGRRISQGSSLGSEPWQLDLPAAPGTYLLSVLTANGIRNKLLIRE